MTLSPVTVHSKTKLALSMALVGMMAVCPLIAQGETTSEKEKIAKLEHTLSSTQAQLKATQSQLEKSIKMMQELAAKVEKLQQDGVHTAKTAQAVNDQPSAEASKQTAAQINELKEQVAQIGSNLSGRGGDTA